MKNGVYISNTKRGPKPKYERINSTKKTSKVPAKSIEIKKLKLDPLASIQMATKMCIPKRNYSLLNKLTPGVKHVAGRDAAYRERNNLVPKSLYISKDFFDGPKDKNGSPTIITASFGRVTNLHETYAYQISPLIDHRRFAFPYFSSKSDDSKVLHLGFGHDKSEIGTVVAGRVISDIKP